MKAKRLTALALAALMAASTTSVALAAPGDVDKDQALNFYAGAVGDDLYMMDEDGYIRAAVDGDFAPGDDIYLALKEYPSASSTELKRMNVYADWAVGKSWVDDIDIVYKKGQWKTDVAKSVTYTFTGLTSSLSKFNGQTFTTNSTESEAIRKAAVAALKDLINKDSDMSGYTKVNTQGSAYVIGNTFYDSKTNALNAMNLKEVSEYYEYNNNGEKKTEISKLTTVAPNKAEDFIADSNYVTKAEMTSKIAEKGFKPITEVLSTNENLKVWGESSSLSNSGKLNIATEENKGTTYTNVIAAGGYDNIYVVARQTDGQRTHYDYINVTQLTDSGVSTALGYTTVTQASADRNYHEIANPANYAITAESMKKSETAYFEGDNFKTTEFDSLGIKAASTVADNMYVESTSPNGKTMVNKDTVQSDRLAEAEKITASNYNAASTFSGNPTGSYDGYTTDSGYAYWVKISTKESTGTKDIDLVGDISIGRTKTSAKGNEVTLGVTLTNTDNANKGDYTDREDDVYIEPGERAVVSFADDASDEFTVEFGDDAYFVFNARGQGKLNLAYNTKYNKDFAYDYDDANIDFINFEGEPTTNRTGTLYIYADEDSYIYEVTSKGAKKINGAYYDDDEEAWVIRTRNLTSYAISDKKLKTVDQMNNGSSSNSSNKPGSSNNKPGNGKPNPDTGR